MNLPYAPDRYSGYRQNRRAAAEPELTHVTPGTPAGEYLRRFWHAIALSSEVRDLPVRLQVMGEDLVLFRDLKGRVGLLHKHCCHRQASLEFGRISEQGIRCCYHGWLFDVDGTILEMPGEPDGGEAHRARGTYRQGAYPALEYKGIVFAYLGPPDKIPTFPIYDTFEMPGTEMVPYAYDFPCNWLQVTENGIDPVHSMFLHANVNGAQFAETWGIVGDVRYFDADISVYCTIGRRVGDNIWTRFQENILPNVTQSGAVLTIDGHSPKYFGRNTFFRWCLPQDNVRTRVIGWANFGDRTDPPELNTPDNIDRLEQGEVFGRSYEEEQRRPGDYAVMIGLGEIVVHKEEHFVTSDRGVARFRNRVRHDIRALAEGVEPTQPDVRGMHPIPTYSGDTVLRIPVTNESDRDRVKDIVERVFDILTSGDQLTGDARDRYIMDELKKFEASKP